MNLNSSRLIHVGINYALVPPPAITKRHSISYQQAIISEGLEFERVETPPNQIQLTREVPSPLRIAVSILAPPVGQLLVIAQNPKTPISLFIKEADAAIQAYEAVWPAPNRQIVKCDATVTRLYETAAEHAFQELWEAMLHQSSDSLATFGRPIRGGGLRLVMDPLETETQPVQIEVKIESFLRDTSKVFLETQFVWLQPSPPGAPLGVDERINEIERFIIERVHPFLSGVTS